MTDPLTDLGDDAWLALFALLAGDEVTAVDGQLCAVLTDAAGVPVHMPALADGVLDRVEDAGFVEHAPDGTLALTDRGRYWVRKWLKRAVRLSRRGMGVLDATRAGVPS